MGYLARKLKNDINQHVALNGEGLILLDMNSNNDFVRMKIDLVASFDKLNERKFSRRPISGR